MIKSALLPATLLALAVQASSARAQMHPPSPGEDPLAHLFFAPELVLQHAQEIGLRPEQRTLIINLIKEAQGDLLELQVAMGDRSRKLMQELSTASEVNENAALAMVDSVLVTEREMKRRQMRLLIRIRNSLTKEQHDKLHQLRDRQHGDETHLRPQTHHRPEVPC